MKSVVKWVCNAWNAAPEFLQGLSIAFACVFSALLFVFVIVAFLYALGEALGAFGVFLGFAIITLVSAGVTLIVGYLRQKR